MFKVYITHYTRIKLPPLKFNTNINIHEYIWRNISKDYMIQQLLRFVLNNLKQQHVELKDKIVLLN